MAAREDCRWVVAIQALQFLFFFSVLLESAALTSCVLSAHADEECYHSGIPHRCERNPLGNISSVDYVVDSCDHLARLQMRSLSMSVDSL